MDIRQSERYVGPHRGESDWWDWSVWLEGSPEDLDRVASVEWILHPTFPQPVRVVKDPATNFRLDTGGWGVFLIHATVHNKDGSQIKLKHYLDLHYPDGTSTTR